jgi:hypothetical protein
MHTTSFTCSRVLFMAAIGAALVVHGCSSSSDDKSAAGGTGTGAGGSAASTQTGGWTSDTDSGVESLPLPDAVGTFTIKLVPTSATGTPAQTQVAGVVREAPLPEGTIWTVIATSGGCKLVLPTIPFCDPVCATDETCTLGATCKKTDPTHHSVGTVTIDGVGTTTTGTTVTMNPTAAMTYTVANVATLSYPPFAEGAAVHLAAAGADYPAFTIDAQGIAPLAMGTSTSNLAPDQPVTLTWTPPAQTGNSRILVNVDISQHGTTKGQIVCDVDDNGSLTIDASLVTRLIGLGVSGFPTIGVTRQASSSATITPGRVDLLLVSTTELEVTVTGFTSCHSDTVATDCQPGQVCSTDYLCVAG